MQPTILIHRCTGLSESITDRQFAECSINWVRITPLNRTSRVFALQRRSDGRLCKRVNGLWCLNQLIGTTEYKWWNDPTLNHFRVRVSAGKWRFEWIRTVIFDVHSVGIYSWLSVVMGTLRWHKKPIAIVE